MAPWKPLAHRPDITERKRTEEALRKSEERSVRGRRAVGLEVGV